MNINFLLLFLGGEHASFRAAEDPLPTVFTVDFLVHETSKSLFVWCGMIVWYETDQVACIAVFPCRQARQFLD